MKQTIRDEQRIEHIWHCISRIQAVAATTSREDLPDNESAQESLFFNLMVLGEAANHLSDEFHAAHPEIPWSKIIGMRNILIHDYSDIDFDIAWRVISHDINELALQIKPIYDALPPVEPLPDIVDLL